MRETAGGVVGTEIFENVVFDEGVGRPSIDGEVAVSIRRIRTREGDRLSGSGVPSLSSYKVPIPRPLNSILSSSIISISDLSSAVGPEGIVITSISTSRTRRDRLALEDTRNGLVREGGGETRAS